MYTLKLKHHFDAAHWLTNYKGPCADLHGHSWVIEVEINTTELKNDMVVDFKMLKEVIDKLDHTCINQKVKFNPTAENLAKYLHDQVIKLINPLDIVVVTVWESPGASITYID